MYRDARDPGARGEATVDVYVITPICQPFSTRNHKGREGPGKGGRGEKRARKGRVERARKGGVGKESERGKKGKARDREGKGKRGKGEKGTGMGDKRGRTGREEAGCESFERKDASLICQRQMISKTDQRGIKDVGI